MSPRNFFAELKRRNIYKVAVAYAVVAWLLIQIATQVFPFFEVPTWAVRLVVLLLLIGFPAVLIFSWAFEITPEGIKREPEIEAGKSIARHTGRKIVAVTIIVAVLAAGLMLFQLLRRSSSQSAERVVAAGPIVEKSIAVLPFDNLSSDKENAYFAEGVQDEILTDLAKVADLKVISRTSVMQYKDAATRNLREIAGQLGVAHILEGSVQRADKRVRINAQLIDARNDAHLWAQTYDRELADVFAIQSEIAQTIAEQLQARLSPNERTAMARAPTADLAAYDLYVRAVALDQLANDPGGKASLLQGISLLEEAIRRDPNFLLAHCLLSETHLDLYWGGFDHTPARREQARIALQNAERIQPDAGEVHLHKGAYAYHGFREYDRALAEFEIARRLLPNSPLLYLYLASVDRRRARWDEAIANFNRAAELDPRNPFIVEESGFTRAGLRRYAEAIPLLERVMALNPSQIFVRATLGQLVFEDRAETGPWRSRLDAILGEGKETASHVAALFVYCAMAERNREAAEQALTLIPAEGTVNPVDDSLWPRDWYVGLVARCFGDNRRAETAFSAARALAAKTAEDQPDYAPVWNILGAIDAGLGRKDEAITEGKHAGELLPVSKDAWEGPSYLTNLALIYTWLGEKDLALEQLAASARIPAGITYGDLKLSPIWDALRGDSRFEEIVASLAPKESSAPAK